MSRIHEALKRAEQERAAAQAGMRPEPPVESSAGGGSPSETAAPPTMRPDTPAVVVASSSVAVALPELPSLREPALEPPAPEPLVGHRQEWKPNASLLVFEAQNPFIPGAEQFRTLRSRLYRIRENQALQTVLVSSAVPAEGKTLVATNLAYAMVRQRGCRVLLVDADLRSPRVHTLLGAPAAPGLADYLQGNAGETDIVQHAREEGFYLVPAGNHVDHPSELISSERMKQFLERVRTEFEWIIIDSPPALPVADASVLGGLVDGVLFVVRANATPSEASLKACKELRDAHILGVILNSADESTEYNSYYASTGYGNTAGEA